MNTDTATTIAEGPAETVYQNRRGVFFSVVGDGADAEWLLHGDAEAVRRRCEDRGLTIVCALDRLPPPTSCGETATTIYVRAPLALKAAIEGCAREAGVSVNVLALRCLEEGVAAFQRRRGSTSSR